MDAKENLRQLHGFAGNQFIVTEGENKGVYDATSEGVFGKLCRELDSCAYEMYDTGYSDGKTQGVKLGGSIVLLGFGVIGCTVAGLYLLSKVGEKSKLKQPCLKKKSE